MSKQPIGDDYAFPMPGYSGMTYRQWLIGQALAGTSTYIGVGVKVVAEHAIERADAVLEILESERNHNGP